MKLPKIVQNVSLYSGATFLQKGIGFFLLPLYTSFLTPEDYGIMNLLTSVFGFMSILILLSLHGASARLHYKQEFINRRPFVWGTIIVLVLINSLFWTSAAIVFHKWIVDPFLDGISFWELTIFSLINVSFSPLYLLYQQWLQTTEKGEKYSINMLLNFLATTFLNILFVAVFKMGILGVLLSSLIVSIIFFIYSAVSFVPKVKLGIDKEVATESYKYALPLVPHSVSGYASVMIDRILLNKLASATTLGLYSVATQFGTIINNITTSINQAFSPWFMKECKNGTPRNDVINQIAAASMYLSSFCALCLVFFTPEAVQIMTSSESFESAWKPILFITFGYVLNGLYYFVSMPLFLSATKYVMLVTLSRLIANVILNILLIPSMGYWGAGIAFLASVFVEVFIAYFLSVRNCKYVNYEFGRLLGIILFFMAISSSVYFIEMIDSLMIKLSIKISITLIVVVGLYIYYDKKIKNVLM